MSERPRARGTRRIGRAISERLSYANVMATVAAVAALAGGAFAIGAVPDRGGKINACYVKKGKKKGQMRLLVSGSRCKKREAKLSWNQQGRQGAPGPATGPAGGDLAGNYPDPLIAPGAIGTGELAGSIPAARVRNSANIPAADGSETVLTFDSEDYDTADLHSTTANTSVLTAPVKGVYAVTAQVVWESNVTGSRQITIRKNSTYVAQQTTNGTSPFATGQVATTQVHLQAGDTVQARAVQNSGVQLNIFGSGETTPILAMTWLAPGP